MAETTDIAELRALVEEQGRHHATEFEELRQQNQLLQQALTEMMMRFPSESESEGDDTTSVSPAAISPPPEPFPNSTFAPYRRELNAVILQTKLGAMAEASKGKKATGKRSYDDLTMAYSPITRPKVQRLYEKSMHEDKNDTEFPIAEIDKSCLESLCTELKRQRRELGSCRLTASEQRRKLSINTVMYHTKELFNEDSIKIEFEAYLRNSSFDSVDVADLLVSRGKCKIVVVESNSHNLLQGQAQDLSLMEIAFADNEKNEEVPTPVFVSCLRSPIGSFIATTSTGSTTRWILSTKIAISTRMYIAQSVESTLCSRRTHAENGCYSSLLRYLRCVVPFVLELVLHLGDLQYNSVEFEMSRRSEDIS